MNLGLGSQPGRDSFHSQAGEISRNDGVTPSERPPLVVTAIEPPRPGYRAALAVRLPSAVIRVASGPPNSE